MSDHPGPKPFKKIRTYKAIAAEFEQLFVDMAERNGNILTLKAMALCVCELAHTTPHPDNAVVEFIHMLEECQTALSEDRRNGRWTPPTWQKPK